MTRVIVVDRDPAAAARRAAELQAVGYEVEQCGGPETQPCAILGDQPCPLADRADVLVYDAWAAGGSDAGRRLIAEVRETYPDLPVDHALYADTSCLLCHLLKRASPSPTISGASTARPSLAAPSVASPSPAH